MTWGSGGWDVTRPSEGVARRRSESAGHAHGYVEKVMQEVSKYRMGSRTPLIVAAEMPIHETAWSMDQFFGMMTAMMQQMTHEGHNIPVN